VLALVGWLVIAEAWHRPARTITAEHANAAFLGKDYATAFDVYAHLSDLALGNIEYHRRLEECARLGHLEKPLLDRYLALVERQPANAIFHNYLGNAYLMVDPKDKDGNARQQYESALRFDASLSAPLANLGILAYRAGKSDEAESFFKRYVAAEPRDAQGWVNLGLLYVNRLQANPADRQAAADAEHALRKAVGVEPGFAAAYKGLGRLLAATDRKPAALDCYQRSLALNFDQPDVRQQVELLAWESGGFRLPGIADDLKTRSMHPDDPNAPLPVVAMRLLDQKQFPQAEAACLKWTKQEPNNPLAWSLLGRTCQSRGHAEDARRAFDRMATLLRQESR